jgi:hypothetical protein
MTQHYNSTIMLSVTFYLLLCWVSLCWLLLCWLLLCWMSFCWASWHPIRPQYGLGTCIFWYFLVSKRKKRNTFLSYWSCSLIRVPSANDKVFKIICMLVGKPNPQGGYLQNFVRIILIITFCKVTEFLIGIHKSF